MNNFLIERKQNFTLNRKVLSIDSNDRDIKKWPNSANFEISCPQTYTNIESIRLLNVSTPSIFYNISQNLQNNKLTINNQIITIEDGNYNIQNLVIVLKKKLQNINPDFDILHNLINNKIYFTSTSDFSLNFNQNYTYNVCNNYNNIHKQHSNWGLGYLLGFKEKKIYYSNQHTSISISNEFIYDETFISPSNYIKTENMHNLDETNFIYLEIEKLNNSDELEPYLINNHTNENNGKINSFFAKFPIIQSEYKQNLSVKDFFIESYSYFQPPLEKINKIKIKLRYHNGMLIDLQNNNISLTFEINQIRNELKDYKVRTPYTY
jgi:hypothetical protein